MRSVLSKRDITLQHRVLFWIMDIVGEQPKVSFENHYYRVKVWLGLHYFQVTNPNPPTWKIVVV